MPRDLSVGSAVEASGMSEAVAGRELSVRGRLKKGLVVLMSGTVIGQFVVFASSPLLTRLYDPDSFAVFAVVTSISSILAIVLAFRLEMLIPIAKTHDSAKALTSSAIVIASAIGLILAVPMLFISPWLEDATSLPGLAHWLWIAPITAAAGTAFQTLNQWAIRISAFGLIATRSIVRPVSMVAAQLLAGTAGVKLGGLPLGLFVGEFASAATMFAKSGLRAMDFRETVKMLRIESKARKSYLAVLSVAGLLNVAATQVPVLLFAFSFSSYSTGQLSLTQKTLAVPVAVVGIAMSQVYINVISSAVRDRQAISATFHKVTAINSVAGLIGGALIAAFGPPVFEFVFGSEWREAGEFARLLAAGMVAQLIAAPISQSLAVLGWARSQLLCDLVRFGGCSGAILIVPFVSDSPGAAVLGLSLAMALSYAFQWMVVLLAVKRHDAKLPKPDSVSADGV